MMDVQMSKGIEKLDKYKMIRDRIAKSRDFSCKTLASAAKL